MVIAFQVLTALLLLDYSVQLYITVIVQTALMILCLSFGAREYLYWAWSFISTMYTLHRFEFKRHACRLILLSSLTMFTIGYVLFAAYFTIVLSSCYVSQMNMNIEHSKDLCFKIFPKHLTPN